MIRRTLTLFVLGAALAGCKAEPETSVKDYMAQDVQPTSEVYWNAVQYISDETGNHDIQPRTDAEWEAVRQAAARLAEIGAELKEPAYAEGRGSGWIDFSNGLIEVAGQAEQAAVAQDVDAVFEVGGTLYSVCTACHQAYPAETPENGADGTG
jgi:hypothetical protein